MNGERSVYFDSSALVKLVVPEPESSALRSYFDQAERATASTLARVEILRSVRPHGANAVLEARALFPQIMWLTMDDQILELAATLDPPSLRSLDAIHLATAQSVGSDLAAVATYDARMTAAYRLAGLTVHAPR
jgi:predicted nucleic acid-binding protein